MKVKTVFWKDGKAVAEAPFVSKVTFVLDSIPIVCYYFSKIKLYPITMITHLHGLALSATLDYCGIKLESDPPEEVDQLRYIHGRLERIPGRSEINSVVVAKVPEIEKETWLTMVPRIFREALARLNIS